MVQARNFFLVPRVGHAVSRVGLWLQNFPLQSHGWDCTAGKDPSNSPMGGTHLYTTQSVAAMRAAWVVGGQWPAGTSIDPQPQPLAGPPHSASHPSSMPSAPSHRPRLFPACADARFPFAVALEPRIKPTLFAIAY